MSDHKYVESGSGFCAKCDDLPGQGEHAEQEQPDLVAFGEPDEFPPGYHPRTGQKLPENLDPSARPGGGDPLADYLHQKGEF